MSLSEAAGMVLAEDIYAAINIPAYAQSSMDGYAFHLHDLEANNSLKIKGEMAAGSNETDFIITRKCRSDIYRRARTRRCRHCGDAGKNKS